MKDNELSEVLSAYYNINTCILLQFTICLREAGIFLNRVQFFLGLFLNDMKFIR